MSFRARQLVAFLPAVLVPMIVLVLFVRGEMTDRITAQYEARVTALVAVIEDDLTHESQTITHSLSALRAAVVDDNRFRRAVVDRAPEERRYLLDYAVNAMQLAGLSMLQFQDETGRIISSGQFRNEYDRLEPTLPKLLASTPEGTALVLARAPDAPFLALASVDSFQMGGRRFTIIAGEEVGYHFLSHLAREGEFTVSVIYPGGVLTSDAESGGPGDDPSQDSATIKEIVRELDVPFVDSERGEETRARIRVSHRLTDLQALLESIDRWFLIAVIVTGILAVLLAGWLSSRISRPLVELAEKTSRLDLDGLDIDFRTDRKDEIGALSRLLGMMAERLRAGANRIRDAERRATLGEVARQVNHDIKNGLIPIRNVFHHLTRLSAESPKELPEVFRERQGTLDSSISYLENLASNYARLSPRGERRSCNVNDIIERVVENLSNTAPADVRMKLADPVVVSCDPLALRRIIENLVDNAIDSLESGPGTVTVSTAWVYEDNEEPRVRIIVADTGRGMSEEEQSKVFDDFYTTKDGGTGLGLSIVRRLVTDIDGTIHLESEEGEGSCFVIELPGVGNATVLDKRNVRGHEGEEN